MLKKLTVIFILILSVCSVFAGCTSDEKSSFSEETEKSAESNVSISTSQEASNEITKLGLGCSGNYGYYEIRGSLIYFFDYKTYKKTVLCNKPNCTHSDEGCNGYIYAENDNDSPVSSISSSAKFMFYKDNSIYLFCTDGRVIKMNFDGEDHRQISVIDGKFGLNCAYKKGDKIYINAFYSEEKNHTIVEKSCFIVYDTNTNEWHQTKSYNRNADILLGITEENVFYLYKNELLPPKDSISFEESIELENNNPCVIYKINFNTGEKDILCEKTEGEIYPATMLNGMIYFHSRKEEAICSLNPESSDISVLAKGVSGQIVFDEAFDGHLVFGRGKKIISEFDPENYIIETFDISSNEIKEAYKLRTNIGWNDGFRGVFAITPDSYIMIYKADFVVEYNPEYAEPSVSDMTPYVGIIRKSDFWSGNYNFKEIQWF